MSTPQPDTAKIAEAAFFLWLDEGRPQGQDRDHWFRATQALTAATKPARKPRAKAAAKPAAARAKAAPKTKAAAKPAAARKPRKKAES